MRKIVLSSVLALGVSSCMSPQKGPDREIASLFEKKAESFSEERGPRAFDQAALQGLVSSRDMKLTEARLILDNDASFDSKLALIRSAKNEIRMVYYIYSLDPSSAVLSQELVKKAASGIKVKLLVDLITNFNQMDYFKWMERESKGNLKVYFYNFPTDQIRSDSVYMTLPCPVVENPSAKECANHKNTLMAKMAPHETTVFSRMLLAGMYGKNPTALKIAMSVGGGIDPRNYKDGAPDEEMQKQLFEFLKLLKDAYFKNDILAKIKVAIALATYGESLNPIMNELTGRLPLGNQTGVMEKRGQEWDHITDYTHHKLLAVDGSAFQLGGRNIEDSYHVKYRVSGPGKYIFVDTDFYGRGAPGSTAAVEKSFDKLLSVRGMIVDMATIEKMMAVDFVANPESLAQATGLCLETKARDMGACIEGNISSIPGYKSEKQRVNDIQASVKNFAAEYAQKYKKSYRDSVKGTNWYDGVDKLSEKDLKSAEFYYLENLPYSQGTDKPERNMGARIGVESKYSKNIHAAWYRGLENACHLSHKEKKDVRVVFHSAYVFMPSGLVYRLAKMINGDYGDCSRVRVTFISNSFATTDLNVINIFSRYQIKEIFQYYERVKASFEVTRRNVAPREIPRMYPTLEYYEYAKTNEANQSLHTKLTLLGEDMIVGSANADARSYAMDTNNALLIRNAHELNRDYAAFVDRLISTPGVLMPMSDYFANLGEQRLQGENIQILQAALQRWDKKGRIKEKHQKRILEEVAQLGERISNDTRKILDFRRMVDNAKFEDPRAVSEVENELNETANRFDDFFKLL